MTKTEPKLVANLKNTFLYTGIGILGLVGLSSCSNNDDNSISDPKNGGTLAISAKGNYVGPNGKMSITGKNANSIVELTSFKLNVKEFELEFDLDDDDYDDDKYDDFYDFDDEIELEGPFELDILKGEIDFITANVPVGTYEELEFKIARSRDSNSDLFGKSIVIEGAINSVPFIFWHDFEEEVEVDFDDPKMDFKVNQNTTNLTIGFDLGLLINGVDGIDLSQAIDGNNDGVIEINPNDADGNKAIAQQLKAKIKYIIDLLDD